LDLLSDEAHMITDNSTLLHVLDAAFGSVAVMDAHIQHHRAICPPGNPQPG
jgi:hypothetical protein